MVYNRVIAAIGIGGRILGRSFMEAYRQAAAASQYQRAQARSGTDGAGASGGAASLASKMTFEEACQILNVKPPTKGSSGMEEVNERYKHLFDVNDPEKGGSFYIQSKVVRARERIVHEAGPIQAQDELDAEVKSGWKPNLYKKP